MQSNFLCLARNVGQNHHRRRVKTHLRRYSRVDAGAYPRDALLFHRIIYRWKITPQTMDKTFVERLK